MLEAHADEIGFMVRYISDQGFVYVTKLGGSDPGIARAKRVFIHTRSGVVSGIFGNTAIHLQDKTSTKKPEFPDLFIDIGVKNKEEALELIQIGDPVTYADDFDFLADDLLSGRAIDNRMGSFIIVQALEKLAKHKQDLTVDVVALNAVQEEIGGFGARMMTHRLKPSLALVTDVTHATDTPGIDKREHGDIKLGEGPTITHGSANHPKLVDFISETAAAHEIAIQHESTSNRTGTDTDSIYFQLQGIPSALISLPLRYMHSPVETVNLNDVKAVIALMTETVRAFKKGQTFSVLF
jgi:endoglucanase